ncbi:MAG: LruC domain-containing protein [Bacteroidota bacterium]
MDKHLYISFPLAFLVLLLTSCQLSLPEPTTDRSMDDFLVSSEFDFSTTHNISLNILVKDNQGNTLPHMPITLYSAPIEKGGEKISYGWTDEQGYFSRDLRIPTTREQVFAYSSSAAIVRSQIIDLIPSSGEMDFVWGTAPTVPTTFNRVANSAFECETGFYQVVYDTLKKLDIATGKYIRIGRSGVGNYNGIGFNPVDNYIYGVRTSGNGAELYKFGTNGVATSLGIISGYNANNAYKGDFGTDGFLYLPVHSGGNWTVAKVDVTSSPPSATMHTLTTLTSVDDCHDFAYNPIQNKFHGITKSGKLAELDFDNLTIKTLADYKSTTGNGPFGAVWSNQAGHVYFSKNSNGKIYQIELDSDTGSPLGISFLLDGDAANNNDGCSCALATAPFDDSDDDEVLDGMDAFPRDSSLAFQDFTPDEGIFGTLSFEDQWPGKGDFDFNDCVIDYNFETARDPQGMIAYIKIKLILKAIGASYKQGFGISFDGLLPTHVDSVSGTQGTEASLLANGLEANQSKAVIIVYDNGHELFDQPTGTFINTTLDGNVFPHKEMEITIHVNRSIGSYGEFNPFIFTRGERGREIHLKNHLPTDLADVSLFGLAQDRSNAGEDVYYQDSQGLPWAIDLGEGMDYPIEKTTILSAYPLFYDWVTSEGITSKDWYTPSRANVGVLFK